MAYLDKSIIKADSKLESKSNYLTFVDQSSGMLELKTDSGMLYNPKTETLIIQNLSVNGTTTTVNTETINLADNMITLNSNIGDTTTPTEDGGIEIKRGNLAATALRWNEADDRWEFTNNGTTYQRMLVDGEYVKSVALSLPTSVFSISGSPVTNSGTLTGTFISQTKNTFFAAPSGGNGTPTFRTIVAADLPDASISAAGIVNTIAQEFVGAKTFRVASTQDGITLQGRAGGTSNHKVILTPTTLTGSRTLTLQDKDGTVALLSDITSGTANKVANALTVKFDSGTTKNTDSYVFDGSEVVSVDIKAGSNVTLTKAANSIIINSSYVDTKYFAGTALDLNTTTFNVNLSKLTTSTTNEHGDYFVVVDSSDSAQYKLTKANIRLSGFQNDSGWTSNTGTVTSVGGTGTVNGLTLTGSITTSGNLTLGGTLSVIPDNFSTQTKNTFLAAPNGVDGKPLFRTIVEADLPSISPGTFTGILPVGKGGTGTSTAPVQGGIIYGASTTAYASTAVGTARQVLISNGTSAPTWVELDMSYIPGATFKKSVLCATTANLASTYATNVLTMSAVGILTIDGIATKLNDRILVKDQTASAQNGIYYVSTEGTASVAAKLTRAIDADVITKVASSQVAVDSGTVNGGLLFETDIKTTDTLGTTSMNWNMAADSGKKLNFFAKTTSAELTQVITEGGTGSGKLVFDTTPIITTPVINDIKASATSTAADLWSEVTTGSITIGAGLTTGALNLGTGGTGATPITIGNTSSTTTILGNAVFTSAKTKIGQTTLVQGGAVSITLPDTAGTLYVSGGTDVAVADGGTGKSSWTTGAVYATASTTLTSGTLPISAGGTGATTTVQGGIVYGSSTTAYATTAVGTSGQVLKSNGTSAPTWVNPGDLSVGSASSVANNLTIKFDTGTTEGTNKYTFNGSEAKTIDIQAGQGISLTKSAGVVTISNTESMITKSTAYTPTATDSIILCDATSGSFEITLPTTAPSGTVYRVKKIDSSTNSITINATTGKLIDGTQTFDLNFQYQAIDVVYNGSSVWYIL